MNWIKYIAVAFLPLTLFLGVIVVFRLSVTSGFCIGNTIFILCHSNYVILQVQLLQCITVYITHFITKGGILYGKIT